MNSSYAAWARFDVDGALERVDAIEQQEQLRKEKEKKVAEKRRVEESISQDAAQSAEVLAAHAAVAALKAKGRTRKATHSAKAPAPQVQVVGFEHGGETRESTGSNASSAEADAETLRRLAEMMAQKHALIKETMDARRRGDSFLESGEESDWRMAKTEYQRALASATALEVLTPQLVELENEQAQILGRRAGNGTGHGHDHHASAEKSCKEPQSANEDNAHCHDHAHRDLSACDCRGHKKPAPTRPVVEALPRKDDLRAIVTMFLKDCFLGVGGSDMKLGQYAAASEAFKEVLLRDEMDLLAWLQRGRAFEALGCPLLAWLHYNRVTNLDAAFEDAKNCDDRIREELVREGRSQEPVRQTNSRPLQNLLHDVKLHIDAGNVIMIEGFFEYAIVKYEKAVALLPIARDRGLTQAHESVITKLETTCHVNIASCYLEMQRHYTSALKHCQLALDRGPGHILANFRLAQVYRFMHSYAAALDGFHTVKMLLSYLPPAEREKQLKTLDDEIDKCHFDRGQYDAAFIRGEMQKSSKS